jgi:hypothetical protein
MAKAFFWVDWSEEGSPAIRPYGAGAKGLPHRFINAKHEIREEMGAYYCGKYFPHGVANITIREIMEQEKNRSDHAKKGIAWQGSTSRKKEASE